MESRSGPQADYKPVKAAAENANAPVENAPVESISEEVTSKLEEFGIRVGWGWIWAIYNDLSRGHPKWWFNKGIPLKMALN